MQIEQNFRDELSARLGSGLWASHGYRAGRLRVLSLLAATAVLWLPDYLAENKGLHLSYQVSSLKIRGEVSYLTLAENVLPHSPLILKQTARDAVLNHLTRTHRSRMLVY
ncbi:hypothetical protein SAMN05216516_104166 [Izhakiella capsodis]|uniref:Uncharacterized protein n=1 Tax=Izhakiella capsodis TaxID=1367852 RepID=A0A1I4XK88_9GAMM|nr:hypothetical protein SAMN05216516_104166 [Izhakiella capsodis]